MQWVYKGFPPSKEAKKQFFAEKGMTTVLWETEGILLVDYAIVEHDDGGYLQRDNSKLKIGAKRTP